MPASQHEHAHDGSDIIRTIVASRLRPPRGALQQTIPLRSKAEFDALRPGWAMPWRDFWFVLTEKRWCSTKRRGKAAFRVM
jgi:hypothetical protein